MESEFHIGEYIAILKRRYIYIIIPFFVVLGISVALAVFLPPVFQSTGTILIEAPQISDQLVRSAVNSMASERIEIIRQRVMTRRNLFRISEKFGVFMDESSVLSTTETVENMREMTGVELINASTGRSMRGLTTIAFKVSFEHRRPLIAVRVANELVTLFLAENVRTRTARASETTEFMEQEATKLEKQLADIEAKIAEYAQEYSDSLPEHLNMRMEMLERSRNDIKELDRDIKALDEEIRFLDIQLVANKAGYGRNQRDGSPYQAAPQSDLKQLQAALDEFTAIYSPSHPDVMKIKRRIEVMKAGIIEGGEPIKLKLLLKSLESQLAAARKRHADSHPDVMRLVAEISEVEEIIETLPEEEEDASPKLRVMDPVLATIETRISVANSRIDSLQEQKAEMNERIFDIEAKIIQTPQVERGFKVLNRDYENAQRRYSEIRAKQMEAELSESLEEDRKAERFVLLEPPSVPEEPIKPDREKMLAIGFALSLAAGGAGIFLVELIDGSIRGTSSLAAVLKQQPLASVPYIVTAREARGRKRGKVLLVLIMLAILVGGLIAVHFFYMPLDIAYYKLLSRF